MSKIDIRWLPESIILLIFDNLSDYDKLYFALVSKKYYQLLNKIFFNIILPLNELLKIPYRNQFKCVEVTIKQIKYLISEKLKNLTSITILCNTHSDDYFHSEHVKIIKTLNIQELIFEDDQTGSENYKIKCKIPKTVKILKFFGTIKCNPDKFPPNLDTLFLNDNAKNYGIVTLSEKITKLYNLNFDNYSNVTIPKSIISLSLHISELNKNILPNTLIYLDLINVYKIIPGAIPSSVTYLTLSHHYNKNILIDTLPPNLTYLNFVNPSISSSFKKCINVGILPQSLTVLKFGAKYDQSPIFIYELINLILLEFCGSKINSLDLSKISKNITHLSTNIYFAKNKIHHNVTNLSIKSYIDNDTLDYLPTNLKKLKIITHPKTKRIITKYIPPTVVELILQKADDHDFADRKIFKFVCNIPHSVSIFKIIGSYFFSLISLPEHIINFKMRRCKIKNMNFLHEKILRLSIPIEVKNMISNKIKRQTRIKYYSE